MIEAFALMFAKPRPVSEQGSFRGYLFRIGRNLAGRHRKKHRLRLLSLDELTFEPKGEVLAETPLYGKEFLYGSSGRSHFSVHSGLLP